MKYGRVVLSLDNVPLGKDDLFDGASFRLDCEYWGKVVWTAYPINEVCHRVHPVYLKPFSPAWLGRAEIDTCLSAALYYLEEKKTWAAVIGYILVVDQFYCKRGRREQVSKESIGSGEVGIIDRVSECFEGK